MIRLRMRTLWARYASLAFAVALASASILSRVCDAYWE